MFVCSLGNSAMAMGARKVRLMVRLAGVNICTVNTTAITYSSSSSFLCTQLLVLADATVSVPITTAATTTAAVNAATTAAATTTTAAAATTTTTAATTTTADVHFVATIVTPTA